MSNLELLDRAAGSTTCQILSAAGGALIDVGVWTLWTGKASLVPFSAGALSLLAANYLCPDMPMGGDTTNNYIDGCKKVDGSGVIQVFDNGDWFNAFPPGNSMHTAGSNAVEITKVEIQGPTQDGRWLSVITWDSTTGTHQDTQYRGVSEEDAQTIKWRIDPTNGTCVDQGDGSNPIPPEAVEPIEYTDNVTNCTYNVTLQGFAQESEHGTVQPVYLVEGATQQRTDGGRMGGCNFPPTIYMPGGGGGGGGYNFPVPSPLPDPGDGVPWWAAPLVAGSVSAGLNLIGQELAKLSEADFPAGSFTMVAPCDYTENGEHQYRTWEFLEGSYQQRVHAHQVALMEMLQQHLDWKTPTCEHERTEIAGEWRTLGFISDHISPDGRDRLRKRFRYRSQSGWTADALVDHWKDFVWQSGPVVVRHLGAWWGSPQVWAESADEGKRVIRHAAGEAGLDPDQVGRWEIGSSRSARYGVPDTMRVCTKGGFYWITARDGANNRPMVSKASDL